VFRQLQIKPQYGLKASSWIELVNHLDRWRRGNADQEDNCTYDLREHILVHFERLPRESKPYQEENKQSRCENALILRWLNIEREKKRQW